MFFTQTLSALVVTAKLERPLDSHAPQTEHVYAYVDDDWGEAYEDEYSHQWESSDKGEQYFEVQDTFATEDSNEEEVLIEEQEQDNEEFDEDDQDNYSWHKDIPEEMDAYISEAQIMSCDEVEEFNMELIQPGHTHRDIRSK